MTKVTLIRILVMIYVVSLIFWIAFGFFFVPQAILAAHERALIEGQANIQSANQLINAWYRIFIVSIITLITIPLIPIFAKRLAIKFFDRFVGLATPEALGGIRFWVFMILVFNVLWEDLPSVSHLPTQLRVQMGMMSLLNKIPLWDSIYTNYNALVVLKYATITVLIFAMIGLKTRWSVPCATILALIHGGILREYSHLFHTCLLPIHVAVVLSFMPCGDGLSVDQYLSRKKKVDISPNNFVRYGWSRYLCWGVVAGAYVSAGLSKIVNGGIWWWQGINLKKIVLTDALNPMHFEWGLEHELANVPIEVFSLLGVSAVLIESLYGLVLFSKRARLVIPVLVVGMHLGIWICQGILFFDLILIQVIFFNFSKLLPRNWQTEITNDHEVICKTDQQTLHQRWFAMCLFVILGIWFCWALRIERYPATAWQMYSASSRDGLITYKKVLVVFSDGHKEAGHPEQWIGALADTRYRDIFWKNEKKQQAFFDTVIRLANREAPTEKIVRVELETYEWNFLTDANNPNLGVLKSVVSYPAKD